MISHWIFKVHQAIQLVHHKEILTVLAQCEYPIQEVFRQIREKSDTKNFPGSVGERFDFIKVSEL